MPKRDQRTGRQRSRNYSTVNDDRDRNYDDMNYSREGSNYENYRAGRNDADVFQSEDLYDESDTGTARAQYSGRQYDRRNSGGNRSHREGNIIQRAADRIREVWEDLMHESRGRNEHDDTSYRNRRNVYSTDERDYESGNWRRENILSSDDEEHHYKDHLHRRPFYDDGRSHSHYDNELEGRLSDEGGRRRLRSFANEWVGRNRRPGSRYSSSDNYHARSDEYEHENYRGNNDRG
jgi:hypothetical protein